MNRFIGSIEQVGEHFIIRSGDSVGPDDSQFHGGKKVVNGFEELVDFLQSHFHIESNKNQLQLEGIEESCTVHRLEIGNI